MNHHTSTFFEHLRARRKRILLVGAMLPVVALFFFLSIQEPICVGDCSSYTLLMGLPPWKGAYWDALQHATRGWTIPVFFSAFGTYGSASAQLIVVAQAMLLLAATGVFAATVASRFAPRRRWCIGLTIATMLAFQQGYLLFSSFILSDAVSWALVLFLLAATFAGDRLLQRFGYFQFLALYLTLGWMAIGARDANQQLLLIFATCVLVMHRGHLTWKQIAGLVAGVLLVCALQAHAARDRYRINLENVLVGRILPDPEARSFFLRHGMPPAYADLGKSLLMQPLNAVNNAAVLEGREKFDRIGFLYLNVAPRTYVLWLLGHPVQVAHILFEDRALVFGTDFLWLEASHSQLAIDTHRLQTGNEQDDRPDTRALALRQKLLIVRPSFVERIPLWLRLACLLLLPAWGAWRNFRTFFEGVGGFALMMAVAGMLNACSGFLADCWEVSEMERHAGIGNMLFNAGILILLVWSVQELLPIESRRRQQS